MLLALACTAHVLWVPCEYVATRLLAAIILYFEKRHYKNKWKFKKESPLTLTSDEGLLLEDMHLQLNTWRKQWPLRLDQTQQLWSGVIYGDVWNATIQEISKFEETIKRKKLSFCLETRSVKFKLERFVHVLICVIPIHRKSSVHLTYNFVICYEMCSKIGYGAKNLSVNCRTPCIKDLFYRPFSQSIFICIHNWARERFSHANKQYICVALYESNKGVFPAGITNKTPDYQLDF